MTQQQPANDYQIKTAIGTGEAFDVIGISVLTQSRRATGDINALWEKFFVERIGSQITDKEDDTIYAVYSDYKGDHTKPYRLTIGYKVPNGTAAAEGLHKVKIATQDYAIIQAAGPQPQTLIESWSAIWQSDMPRTYKTDFEVYGPRFFDEAIGEVLIHIGVEKDSLSPDNI